jgi:hypothetical protein
MTVDETLHLWRTTGFVWGQSDCLLSIGDYGARNGAVDVASGFRGTYDTEEGAQAAMDAAGGAMALVARMGWLETREPVRGDVAVINLGGIGPASLAIPYGALCTGEGFAFRRTMGVCEIPRRFARIMKAWTCPL